MLSSNVHTKVHKVCKCDTMMSLIPAKGKVFLMMGQKKKKNKERYETTSTES